MAIRSCRSTSAFGMYEMEEAADVILQRCLDGRSWLTPAGYEHMSTDHAKAGFLQLLARGWLQLCGNYKTVFCVNQTFVDRMIKNEVTIGELPAKAPSLDELAMFI